MKRLGVKHITNPSDEVCCEGKLRLGDMSCWRQFRSTLDNDAYCEGSLVCARKGWDHRSFGCTLRHCCSQMPKVEVVPEWGKFEDLSLITTTRTISTKASSTSQKESAADKQVVVYSTTTSTAAAADEKKLQEDDKNKTMIDTISEDDSEDDDEEVADKEFTGNDDKDSQDISENDKRGCIAMASVIGVILTLAVLHWYIKKRHDGPDASIDSIEEPAVATETVP